MAVGSSPTSGMPLAPRVEVKFMRSWILLKMELRFGCLSAQGIDLHKCKQPFVDADVSFSVTAKAAYLEGEPN